MKKLLIIVGMTYLTVQLSLAGIYRMIASSRTTKLIERHHVRRLEQESGNHP